MLNVAPELIDMLRVVSSTYFKVYSSSPLKDVLCIPVGVNILIRALSRSHMAISPNTVVQTPVGQVLLLSYILE